MFFRHIYSQSIRKNISHSCEIFWPQNVFAGSSEQISKKVATKCQWKKGRETKNTKRNALPDTDEWLVNVGILVVFDDWQQQTTTDTAPEKIFTSIPKMTKKAQKRLWSVLGVLRISGRPPANMAASAVEDPRDRCHSGVNCMIGFAWGELHHHCA